MYLSDVLLTLWGFSVSLCKGMKGCDSLRHPEYCRLYITEQTEGVFEDFEFRISHLKGNRMICWSSMRDTVFTFSRLTVYIRVFLDVCIFAENLISSHSFACCICLTLLFLYFVQIFLSERDLFSKSLA